MWIKYNKKFYFRGYVDSIDSKVNVKFYENEESFSFAFNDHIGLVHDKTPKELKVLNTFNLF